MQICKDFLIPQYGGDCFSSLPGVLENLLLGSTKRDLFLPETMSLLPKDVKNVVFILFDAFGRKSFNQFLETSPYLQAFIDKGLRIPTTSQFPSTTAAHVSTIMSGIPVYETGVCEWFYYEPLVEGVINPFKLNYYNEDKLGTLLSRWDVSEILPRKSFFADLASQGITSFRYAPSAIEPSVYGEYLGRGSELFAYATLAEGISRLKQNTKSTSEKQFHYLYIPDYDSTCHEFGPDSAQAANSAKTILKTLEDLLPVLEQEGTAVVMTADHGQVSIDPETAILINKIIPELPQYLAKTASGKQLRFGGGYRNLLLYAEHGAKEPLVTLLREKLRGAADVYTEEEAAQFGLLGPLPLSSHFSQRIGDVIVVPYEGYSVNWSEPGVYIPTPYKGHHGGLTRSEMETDFSILWS